MVWVGYKYNMEKELWERFFASLEDESGQKGLRRLVNNANALASGFEAHGILTEASMTLRALKNKRKKINLSVHDRDIDNILVFVFLKSITTIPSKTKAYRLGLIDKNGVLIKQPVTKEEHDCISNLDLLMFKIREWLRPKMVYLSNINWVRGIYNNQRIQNQLANTSMLAKQFVVRQLNSQLDDILRKH